MTDGRLGPIPNRLQGRKGDVASSAVTGHQQTLGGMGQKERLIHRQRVVERSRKRMFRRQTIVHHQQFDLGFFSQIGCHVAVTVRAAHDEPTAVKIQAHRRVRTRTQGLWDHPLDRHVCDAIGLKGDRWAGFAAHRRQELAVSAKPVLSAQFHAGFFLPLEDSTQENILDAHRVRNSFGRNRARRERM